MGNQLRGSSDRSCGDEAHSAELALGRIAQSSRFLQVLFFIIAGFFCVAAIALIPSAVIDPFFHINSHNDVQSQFTGLFTVIGLFINSAILFLSGLIFRDIALGNTPFSLKQAKRIRAIAWLLLAYTAIDAILPTGVFVGQASSDASVSAGHLAASSPTIQVGSLIVAIVFFFLSSVFKYGVKLQELSDDTV